MQHMAAAFRKDSPRLRAAFNAFLEEMKRTGAFQAIVRKYYPYILDYYPGFFKEQ
jgi:ABC-type amino acid transport substrate-binding protein